MRSSVLALSLFARGREYPISLAIDGDTPWELTVEGAASVTLPLRSPDLSLLDVLSDEGLLQTDGVSCRIDGVTYVVATVAADDTGLFTLVLEDEVAWRLRQFTRFLSASRATVTRAGFVRRMAEEASRPPRARMRTFIPEVRDVQPIARSTT